jgi:dTDP-4-dehydrorhamnose reductase
VARLLITGASGLLGAGLALEACEQHEVMGVYHSHPLRSSEFSVCGADLSQPGVAHDVMREFEPDWVVHCAAETRVDAAEREPERAFLLNRDMARVVAEAGNAVGAKLIHISTDAVFDGTRGGYSEQDVPSPLTVYGRSKLAGEHAVLKAHPEACVVRTTLFGWNALPKFSLAEWFLDHLEKGLPCNGFIDVYANLIFVNDLSALLLRMLEKGLEGIYHVAARDCLSKHDFGVQLAAEFGLNAGLIQPVSVDTMEFHAVRSKNLCLSTEKITRDAGVAPPSIAEGIRHFRETRENQYLARLKMLMQGV